MRVKEWIALPAAILLAGGPAAAQTTTAAPTAAQTTTAAPAQVSQGIAGPVNPTKPALRAQEDALKAQQEAKARSEQERARYQQNKARFHDMVRDGIAPMGSFYPGGSTYPYLAYFQQNPRFRALTRPVDVRFDHATVRQVAETLTKASGATVLADPGVPSDIRLTVDARGVPLATVLDAIANQAHLLIAPLRDAPAGKTSSRAGAGSAPAAPAVQAGTADAAPDRPAASGVVGQYFNTLTGSVGTTATSLATLPQIQGVILKSEPSLKVGDNPRVDFSSPTAPWSEEWFQSAPPVPQFTAGMQENRAGRDYVVVRNPFGGPVSSSSADIASSFTAVKPGTFAIAALGEHELVVAEPAPNGEPGVLLSVYRLENGQLRKVSVLFHRFASGRSSAARRPDTGNTSAETPRYGAAVPPAQPRQPVQPKQPGQAAPNASPGTEAP